MPPVMISRQVSRCSPGWLSPELRVIRDSGSLAVEGWHDPLARAAALRST